MFDALYTFFANGAPFGPQLSGENVLLQVGVTTGAAGISAAGSGWQSYAAFSIP
jgi:hypothetical protein